MKKIYLSLLLCILFAVNGFPQSISVKSFRLLENDLTANTAGTMEKDQNGETAALIKVVTTQMGFSFDCGSMGVVRTLQKPSEIWVYVPRGVKKMTISHPQLGLLRDYYLNIPIESARTYEIVLVTGEVQTIVKQARTSQYVVFQLEPANAVVEVDGGMLETVDGTATKMLKFGTYNYRVQAPDHLPEAGTVTVGDPDNKHVINIKLKPNYSSVLIKVDNDAEIWINGEKKGSGVWFGNLGAGIYEIEAKKAGHHSTLSSHEISIAQERQTIQLQAPIPIYGEVEIESRPAMADIYVDGQKVGQTPQSVRNILVGDHVVVIKKDGYADYTSSLSVKENETEKLVALLNKPSLEGVDNNTVKNVVQRIINNMVFVDGGTFTMGATVEQEQEAFSGEKPSHQVTVSSFSIGKYEVTQEEWQAVMGSNPSQFRGPNLPIENVSWRDCVEFVRRLNFLTGKYFRLPTEAEWEFAARGGNQSQGFKYAGSDNLSVVAWYDKTSENKTHEVGQKTSNELGLYDMSGNVWEWCYDKYGCYNGSNSLTNPRGPSIGSDYVVRGGGWRNHAEHCRISRRMGYNPSNCFDYIGLRLVLANGEINSDVNQSENSVSSGVMQYNF
jgi:Uncharacterized conserved protein